MNFKEEKVKTKIDFVNALTTNGTFSEVQIEIEGNKIDYESI